MLETERLLMRPPKISDLGPLHEVWGDRDVMRWIGPGDAYSRDMGESERRLERLLEHQETHGFSLWVVVERDTGTLVGDCGLVEFAFRGPEFELACCLHKGAWGEGYATEGGRAWLDLAFGELGLPRVLAAVHPEHEAAQRVLEKLGMRRERRTMIGETEVLVYAIEREEAEPATAS
jgi:[ribosomal protein S5]-alanine N-acetyltransferase